MFQIRLLGQAFVRFQTLSELDWRSVVSPASGKWEE
jgi:hypothetical protein